MPDGNSHALTAATALPATDEPVTEGTLTEVALAEPLADVADLTEGVPKSVETVFGIAETLRRDENAELRVFGSFRLRRGSGYDPDQADPDRRETDQ